MRRSIRLVLPLSMSVLLLVAGAALAAAAPSVLVTQPSAGQTISKNAGPIPVSGLVQFEEPAPTDTRLYLRYVAVGTNNCGRRFLSTTNGPDAGNSCQSTGGHLTLVGQSFTRDWPADPEEVALPLTIDASRNITGQININSRFLGVAGGPVASPGNWVTLDVVVRLGMTTLTQSFDSGAYTGATHSFPVDIDIPASLDKTDVGDVQVDLVWHRVVHLAPSVSGVGSASVIHTHAELENPATFLSVPSYSASFNRRVEVAVDSPSFTGSSKVTAAVNLGDGTFSASLPTGFLQPGERTLYARAIQGGGISDTDAVPFTLTS